MNLKIKSKLIKCIVILFSIVSVLAITTSCLLKEESHLTKCAENGNLNRCRELLDNGTDVNIKDNEGRTFLHWAARDGHI